MKEVHPPYDDFVQLCGELYREHPEWRWGQTVFNALYRIRPELADHIRGTASDPFFEDKGKLGPLFIWLAIFWWDKDWKRSLP